LIVDRAGYVISSSDDRAIDKLGDFGEQKYGVSGGNITEFIPAHDFCCPFDLNRV
jgi:hypothetical protein